jgi:hypothetical protein
MSWDGFLKHQLGLDSNRLLYWTEWNASMLRIPPLASLVESVRLATGRTDKQGDGRRLGNCAHSGRKLCKAGASSNRESVQARLIGWR